jgi:2-oxoisovalerate dehydrogenase E2 component (dihydrolipoyl transacylase)
MPSWVLRFPDLGEGIDEGEVTRWLVEVADHVHVDQAVCEVETNKVNTELTTAYEGTVLALHAAAQTTAGVGRTRRGAAGTASAERMLHIHLTAHRRCWDSG